MIEFTPQRIYGIDTDGEVIIGGCDPVVELSLGARMGSLHELRGSIPVTGLSPQDFALFATISGFDSAVDEFPTSYFVSSYGEDESIITQSDLVMSNPERYSTPEMAEKILAISEDDLRAFSITALARDLRSIYRP